jgi:hypothetical protein
MLRIGEIFTRYLFIIVSNKKKNTDQNKNLIEFDKSEPEKFYNQDNNNISNFDEWSDSMKYFLVILLLIDLLFNSSSNYKSIFNNKSLKESITELIKNDKTKNKKSEKNKKFNSKLLDIFKGTKQKGLRGGFVKNYPQKKGFKPKTEKSGNFKQKSEKSEKSEKSGNFKPKIEGIGNFKIKTNNKKRNNKNKVSLKAKLDNILKDTEINTSTKTLLSFYDIKFKNKMLDYFKEEIKKKFYKKNVDSNIKNNKNIVDKDIKLKIHNITIINPFHTAAKDKPEKLSEYLDLVIKNNKKRETDYNFIELSAFLKSHFKYNIYNFLYFFKDSQYENKLFDFIKKIKMKVLLLLFSLYIKKKYLYEAFINATSQIISINNIKLNNSLQSEKKNTGESSNPSINNEEQDKYSSQIKTNKSKRIEKEVLNKLNNKNKGTYVKINSNIKLIQRKIAILDEKYFNNVNYDIKKMQLEKIYHRLIIQKRDILNS